MNNDEQNNYLLLIKKFIKSLISEENINKLMSVLSYKMSTVGNVKNYDIYKNNFDQKQKNINDFAYINNFVNNFLNTSNNTNIKNEQYDISIFENTISKNICDVPVAQGSLQKKEYKFIETSDNSNYTSILNNTYTTTNTDIYGEIKTTLEEVYKGMIKEITVKRQLIIDNEIIFKSFTHKIPLNNDRIILDNQGDDYLINNEKGTGNLIIDIKYKKHKYFKRVNEYDILVVLPLTLYELFYGFVKLFNYFESNMIELITNSGFANITSNKQIIEQSKFDGNKIKIVLSKLGIFNNNGERGNLIVYLLLIKDDDFNLKLHNSFN